MIDHTLPSLYMWNRLVTMANLSTLQVSEMTGKRGRSGFCDQPTSFFEKFEKFEEFEKIREV